MSLEQLKNALAKKQQKNKSPASGTKQTASSGTVRSQVSEKKPTKKSAGRGR